MQCGVIKFLNGSFTVGFPHFELASMNHHPMCMEWL